MFVIIRYGEMMSRPGSMMMGPMPGAFAMSRPASRTGSRPTSGKFLCCKIKVKPNKLIQTLGSLQPSLSTRFNECNDLVVNSAWQNVTSLGVI